MPKEINKADFNEEVLKGDLPVLVDFWASWCGPCKVMAPILEELEDELKGKLKIVKVDTEAGDNMDLATEYGVMSLPTMKVFKNGAEIAEFIGSRSKEEFTHELTPLI